MGIIVFARNELPYLVPIPGRSNILPSCRAFSAISMLCLIRYLPGEDVQSMFAETRSDVSRIVSF